jgi:phosphate starvation-inducible membrane PsiE
VRRPSAVRTEVTVVDRRLPRACPLCESTAHVLATKGGYPMSKLTQTIKKELYEMTPPTLFFFVALHIVALIRALMAKGTGIPLSTTASVAIAALVLGKAVLIADMLPIINRFPQKPLVYNVSWKTLIYLVVAGIIHYAERLIEFARQAGGLIAGNEKMLSEMVWPQFWAVQVLLFVLIVLYCTIYELIRAIGKARFLQMFFGPFPVSPVSQ